MYWRTISGPLLAMTWPLHPPSPLPATTMSGSTPSTWKPHMSSPRRPRPHCTSSLMHSAPQCSRISLQGRERRGPWTTMSAPNVSRKKKYKKVPSRSLPTEAARLSSVGITVKRHRHTGTPSDEEYKWEELWWWHFTKIILNKLQTCNSPHFRSHAHRDAVNKVQSCCQ